LNNHTQLGSKKKEHKEQSTLLSDESLHVGNLVVVENHGDQPHKAHIVDINMENKWALIRWETTQKIDYVDVEDFKLFLMEDLTPRKQKIHRFFLLLQEKKLHQLSNIKMTNLICNIAQKINFIL
jgi:hypothetical protein